MAISDWLGLDSRLVAREYLVVVQQLGGQSLLHGLPCDAVRDV